MDVRELRQLLMRSLCRPLLQRTMMAPIQEMNDIQVL